MYLHAFCSSRLCCDIVRLFSTDPRLPQWIQYTTCGSSTADIDIHNCAVSTWDQLIPKLRLPDSWTRTFKGELQLLSELSRDRDAILQNCGFPFDDPKGRCLELLHGSRPVGAEIEAQFVVRVQRLGRLLRILAPMIWFECYDYMLNSQTCVWPESSCMSKVY